MNKRDWLMQVLRNETPEKTPLGFWFHFAADELTDGFIEPEIIRQNIEGHRKFFNEFQPDMIKIMTDGFFIYPNREFQNARTAADLWKVKPIGGDHPWITEQAAFVRTITGLFGKDVMCFCNIFSPATTFKFVRLGSKEFRITGVSPDTLLADLIIEDKDAVIHALDAAARDLALLAQRVTEAGADGVYLSAQNVSDARIDGALHQKIIASGDHKVLAGAKSARSGGAAVFNILHVCGYEGHHNNLSHFVDYPAEIINWAAVFEGVSLGEGKKLFGGRPVIGGFDNTTAGLLYRGGKAEIQAETRRLLAEAGRAGVILGADCTLPRDINIEHLRWVREAASQS
jgi:uroporphyrinogen decarboxylase